MFHVAEEIQSSSVVLGDWPLSRVFLKNDINIPWFLLVPRKVNVREVFELTQAERQQLMEEINQLSSIVTEQYQPYKLNVGWLGNIVSQLHIHVVGTPEELSNVLPKLRERVNNSFTGEIKC